MADEVQGVMTPEQMTAALADKPIIANETTVTTSQEGGTMTPPEEGSLNQQAHNASQEYKMAYADAWSQLEKEGIAIPEDFKQGKFGDHGDEWKAFINTIMENTSIPGEDDPFIQGYLKTDPEKRADFIKNFTQQEDFYSLDSDKGIRTTYQMYKNENGERKYTDEAIDEYITSLKAIEKENIWDGIKAQKKETDNAILKERQENFAKNNTERITRLNEQRSQIVDKLFEPLSKQTDINGIPISDEFKSNVKEQFKLLNTINPKTGNAYLMDYIGNNDNLMRMVIADALLHEKSNPIVTFLSSYKEDFKEELLNKLSLNPRPSSSSAPFARALKTEDFK